MDIEIKKKLDKAANLYLHATNDLVNEIERLEGIVVALTSENETLRNNITSRMEKDLDKGS